VKKTRVIECHKNEAIAYLNDREEGRDSQDEIVEEKVAMR